MKVIDLVNALGLEVFSGQAGLEKEIAGGYVSDLLSDVMGFAREGEVWVTLQTHQNVMAVASLKDLAAVILVKGFTPEPDTIEHSNEEHIPCWEHPFLPLKWREDSTLCCNTTKES